MIWFERGIPSQADRGEAGGQMGRAGNVDSDLDAVEKDTDHNLDYVERDADNDLDCVERDAYGDLDCVERD